jgi:glycosidase
LSGRSQQDWRRWVVYQIYPRSFADSDGDGVGDLRGIIGHVDYLHRLGVDVVWLSPVYRSPMDDNGYDISDYQDIDPLFGTLADLDELIAQLHARGMKLVMDLVVNHTSDEHPWFIESRSSRDNPKRDWYWWRDKPPNWESLFSSPAWTLDEKTGQYYLHIFSAKQPDLNWENPEVRQAERGWNSLYFGNHDQPRSVSRFGDDSAAHRVASAKSLATVLHLHRGTPYVYQGDELAMANAPFTAITDYRDIETLRFYAEAAERPGTDLPALLAAIAKMSRDQGRTPVQWDASPGAGFTTGRPWLAINPDHTTVNAAAQVGEPGSVFEHYRRLIALRHEDPVVTDGDFELLLPEHPAIWAFLRRTAEAELLVAANFSADVVDAALPLDLDWADASVVLTSLDGDAPLQAPPGLKLRPWESVVWRQALT